MCLKTTDDPTGCLEWDKAVEDDPNFIYECFTCAQRKRPTTVSIAL